MAKPQDSRRRTQIPQEPGEWMRKSRDDLPVSGQPIPESLLKQIFNIKDDSEGQPSPNSRQSEPDRGSNQS